MQEKMGSSRDGLCSAAAIHHTDGPRGCGERGKNTGRAWEKRLIKMLKRDGGTSWRARMKRAKYGRLGGAAAGAGCGSGVRARGGAQHRAGRGTAFGGRRGGEPGTRVTWQRDKTERDVGLTMAKSLLAGAACDTVPRGKWGVREAEKTPGQILGCPQVLSGRWVGDDRGFFLVPTARHSWERQLLPGETAQPALPQKSPAKTQGVCWVYNIPLPL